MANAINRLKKVEVTKETVKKETLPVVPNFDKAKIDQYIELDAQLKEVEFKHAQLNGEIALTANSFLQSQSEFVKSARIYGTNGSVRVVNSDKFSVVQEVGADLVKLGVAEESRTVSLKKEVIADEKLLDKFLAKFTDAEIGEFLDVYMKYTPKKGLDEVIYKSDAKVKKQILEGVKQAKSSVVCE